MQMMLDPLSCIISIIGGPVLQSERGGGPEKGGTCVCVLSFARGGGGWVLGQHHQHNAGLASRIGGPGKGDGWARARVPPACPACVARF